MAEVTHTKTARDWAFFTEKIAQAFPDAEKIILLEDNLNTHKAASWYEVFPPEKADWLMERFELVYTPKHGSWLNIAEIELMSYLGNVSNGISEIFRPCVMKLPHGKRSGTTNIQ